MKAEEVTQQQLQDNYIPIHVRDNCASVLIPLNKCRRKNVFMPWACHDELHSYEICMYQEYERRRAIKAEASGK